MSRSILFRPRSVQTHDTIGRLFREGASDPGGLDLTRREIPSARLCLYHFTAAFVRSLIKTQILRSSTSSCRGIPADVRDAHGNTILLVACQNGLKRVLKTALRRGADVNATNARGNTALHYCFAFGEQNMFVRTYFLHACLENGGKGRMIAFSCQHFPWSTTLAANRLSTGAYTCD